MSLQVRRPPTNVSREVRDLYDYFNHIVNNILIDSNAVTPSDNQKSTGSVIVNKIADNNYDVSIKTEEGFLTASEGTFKLNQSSSRPALDRKIFSFNYGSFPDTITLYIISGYWLDEIVVKATTAFDVGSLTVADSSETLLESGLVDLTSTMPSVTPICKKYSIADAISVTLTGSPTVGSVSIILKLVRI